MVRTKKSPSKQTPTFHIGSKNFYIKPKLLRTIKRLQNTTEMVIPKLPFSRLTREIMQDVGRTHYTNCQLRIQARALEALQEAAEMYLVGLFEDGNLVAGHARRVTLRVDDVSLVLTVRGVGDVANH